MMRRLSLLGFLLVCALSVAQLLHAAWVLPENTELTTLDPASAPEA